MRVTHKTKFVLGHCLYLSVFWSFACFLLSQSTTGLSLKVDNEDCVFKSPCRCETEKYYVDLTALSSYLKGQYLTAKDRQGFAYHVSPCDVAIVNIPPCTRVAVNLTACQISTDGSAGYGLGEVYGYSATGDPGEKTVVFHNSFLSDDGITRAMDMNLKCSKADMDFQFNSTSGSRKNYRYTFTLFSRFACPISKTSGSSGGLSAGSILVILFFVFILVYLIGGVIFLKFVRKAEGREVIPNYEFWKELPSLIRDGVVFTCRGCKAETTYEKI